MGFKGLPLERHIGRSGWASLSGGEMVGVLSSAPATAVAVPAAAVSAGGPKLAGSAVG